MPWGVAAAAVGAGIGAVSSNSASKKQQSGANAALGEQQREYDTTRNDNQTALDARNNSLAMMQNKAGQYSSSPTAASVMAEPGYQFGMDQGRNSLEGSASAGGGLYSGATMKALQQYGNDYGTTKFDDAFNRQQTSQDADFNRYASIGGLGQVGTSQIGQAGQNMANNNSAIDMANGRAQAGFGVANGNMWGSAFNQAGSALANGGGGYGRNSGNGGWFSGQMGTVGAKMDGSYNQDYGNEGVQHHADGGPVRQEPVIGSKSPVRTGGGGGLSPNAILAAMAAKNAPVSQDGIGALPANYLMNPKAVLDAQMQQAGAYKMGGAVHGPGGPRTDSIPARLSNGEHVMDAASVNALGGGSNEAGQQKLNKLRAMIKGGR